MKLEIQVGPEAFRFTDYAQYSKAVGRFYANAKVRAIDTVCISSAGRVCQSVKDFQAARDNNEFPVVVYRVNDA